MASDAATSILAQITDPKHDDLLNGDHQNTDSFMENGTNATDTTLNIKDVPTVPDISPAGPTPVDDVSSGIQPVADFLPKDLPKHSHPTPPPDQPLATGEADVDTEMANVADEAPSVTESAPIVPAAEPIVAAQSDVESMPVSAPPEQGLVRPREDDADGDDERVAKRSKVEDVSESAIEDTALPTTDVVTNGDHSADAAVEPSVAEILVAHPAASDLPSDAQEHVSQPTSTDPSSKPPSAAEPSLATSSTVKVEAEHGLPAQSATSTSDPVTADSAQVDSAGASKVEANVKPSVEAPTALQASAPSAEAKYSTSPMTPAQKGFLIEKTKNLKKTKSSASFLRPVDPVALNIPSYPEIIKQPMDLGTLDQKLKSGAHTSVQDYVNDFQLIVDNCRTFNGPNHPVTLFANSLAAYFYNVVDPSKVPSANQPAPQKAVKRASPAVKAEKPRRESRNAATAASPTANAETFALQADGMPQIRRDSTMNRPARAIKPPASREVTYAKPKRKEHQLELRFCDYVLKEIKSPRYSASNVIFQNPVDPVAQNIPHYRQVVKHPMDLSTMTQKLNQGQYAKAGEFKKDFDLMIGNCLLFNPPGNPVRDLGIQLQRDFNALWTTKEKWERANKPETRATSASSDDESGDEEDEDDEPEEDKKQTLEALQKQLAEIQQKMSGLVDPGAKASKNKKSNKSKSSKPKVGSMSSTSITKKAAPPKPTKAKKPKQVTYEEKQEISEAVGNMSETQVGKLTSIITENCTKYRDMEDMELEIDDLPNNVQLLLLSYVREIFGRPKKVNAPAARDTSDDDIAGQDDDDFKPRGNVARADGKRKKHKPMGRSEQTQAIQNLKGKLAQFNQKGTSGSESPTNSSFNAGAAAESSGDDESEESEEE